MMLVVPPATPAEVPVKKSSLAVVPMKGSSICVCGSMPPGITSMPPASTIFSAGRRFQAGPDRGDRAVLAQHIGAEAVVRR